MSELLFPVAALVATFFVLVPCLTLVSHAVLRLRRQRTRSLANFGSEKTFALLVAPTLIPVLWLTSSALHQSEPMQMAESCLIDHSAATTCTDTLLLLGLLIAGSVAIIGLRLWCEWPRLALKTLDKQHDFVRQVESIAARDKYLKAMRISVVHSSPEPIYTFGLFRPRVVVDACFVRDADSELIRAALLHEHAHVGGRDILRSFIVRVCLTANPAGWLLRNDFHRWRTAREALCDGEAVHRGGEALALAEGIVRAAKFRCVGLFPQAAALCGHSKAALNLRIALLLSGPPAPVKTVGHILLGLGVIVALGTPHVEGLGLLERFHFEVERLFHSRL